MIFIPAQGFKQTYLIGMESGLRMLKKEFSDEELDKLFNVGKNKGNATLEDTFLENERLFG